MKMLVIIEEAYKMTVWCREKTEGLRREARKKRINLAFTSDPRELLKDGYDNSVIVVGTDMEWLDRTTEAVLAAKKHPIVMSNRWSRATEGRESSVSADVGDAMKEIFAFLTEKKVKKCALYAINPSSMADECRRQAFLASGGDDCDVFYNRGSLEDCFCALHGKKSDYDAIICSNDFAAISLIRHFAIKGESLDGVYIVSYSDTLLARCTSPSVSTVSVDYKSFGELALFIADGLGRCPAAGSIHALARWELKHRETTSGKTAVDISDIRCGGQITARGSGDFYSDPEMLEMIRIENLLSSADETDIEVLCMMLDGKTTSEICEACYLGDTAVKYRIKKMKELCSVSTRAELAEMIGRYVKNSDALKRIYG